MERRQLGGSSQVAKFIRFTHLFFYIFVLLETQAIPFNTCILFNWIDLNKRNVFLFYK